MKCLPALALIVTSFAGAQHSAPGPANGLDALRFLEGTWEAKTQAGASGVAASGSYTFRRELDGHIMARHSSSNGCKGPTDFDCNHRDLLYIYQEAPGQSLKAIYFDSEGHVLHYALSIPSATTAVFLSDTSVPGPQFRLTYELRNGSMAGKFQMHMPGQAEWKSYLEWIGPKK